MRSLEEAQDGLIAQWQLGRALRAAREAAGLTQGELALALGWSLSTVMRAEKGSGVSVTDLRAFLGECGVTDRLTAEQLASLARAGRARPWHKERGTAGLYLSCEAAAAAVAGHHSYLVPPLLQTERYARGLAEAVRWPAQERLASLLRERQARAAAASPRRSLLRYTIAEEALYRTIGGDEAWRAQIRYLQGLADSGHAEIRVVPLEAGAIPVDPASFTVFEIGADLLAFTGWASPDILVDAPEQAAGLRRQADGLAEAALSPAESARRLSQIAARTRQPDLVPGQGPRGRAALHRDACGPEPAL